MASRRVLCFNHIAPMGEIHWLLMCIGFQVFMLSSSPTITSFELVAWVKTLFAACAAGGLIALNTLGKTQRVRFLFRFPASTPFHFFAFLFFAGAIGNCFGGSTRTKVLGFLIFFATALFLELFLLAMSLLFKPEEV
jgi:hypothetical protein